MGKDGENAQEPGGSDDGEIQGGKEREQVTKANALRVRTGGAVSQELVRPCVGRKFRVSGDDQVRTDHEDGQMVVRTDHDDDDEAS